MIRIDDSNEIEIYHVPKECTQAFSACRIAYRFLDLLSFPWIYERSLIYLYLNVNVEDNKILRPM